MNEEKCWETQKPEQSPTGKMDSNRTRSNSTSVYHSSIIYQEKQEPFSVNDLGNSFVNKEREVAFLNRRAAEAFREHTNDR